MSRSRRSWPHLVLWALAVVSLGCSPPAQEAEPVADLPTSEGAGATALEKPPTVLLPDGFAVTLEVATTTEERNRGLMFRTTLERNRGMLFVFEMPGYPSFWMKDTWIPLDLLFLDEAGAVRHVAAEVPPCAAEPCPLYSPPEPVVAVLELAAGVAGEHGVEVGSALQFHRVEGLPRPFMRQR